MTADEEVGAGDESATTVNRSAEVGSLPSLVLSTMPLFMSRTEYQLQLNISTRVSRTLAQ